MNLFTITILAALLYIAYRIAGRFTSQKDETPVSLEKPIAVMKATPKKKKVKETKSEFPIGDHHDTIKPKRKYNKKPKA
jgi:hypothetical protein